MRFQKFVAVIIAQGMLLACNSGIQNNNISKPDSSIVKTFQPGTFGYDFDFLSRHGDLILLSSADSSAQIIVSPKYQGKVFTSTARGSEGQSFGWVNYKAFGVPSNEHMNAYGGENRLWLGPEGGHFSLFFTQGDSMDFEHWKTPAAFDSESWVLISHSTDSVHLQKKMNLVNFKGTHLDIQIDRTIGMLNHLEIARLIGEEPGSTVHSVAYATQNHLTNTGKEAWTEQTGMPCLWILDMFKPSPSTIIVVPYSNNTNEPLNKIVTSNYFGQIPANRLKNKNSKLFFKADGNSRGKLGVHPTNAKPVIGSYDSLNQVLTIILFDVDASARYLNQEWNTIRPSFSGDAVNAYNDGPLADGSQMGPFYEMESVSPAAFLKPGERQSHRQTVLHFTGEHEGLDRISKQMLGVSLDEIEKIF